VGRYYGVIERGDKQIWRSVKRNDRTLAERHLNELLKLTDPLPADLGCKTHELISPTSTKVTAPTVDALDKRHAPPFRNRTAARLLALDPNPPKSSEPQWDNQGETRMN